MRCVGKSEQQEIPVVELLKRLPSGIMMTINGTIEMDKVSRTDWTWKYRPERFASPPPEEKDRSTVAVVPEAEVPDLQSTFDVRVCKVSNPHHFYVQPLQTLFALHELTRQLKVRG